MAVLSTFTYLIRSVPSFVPQSDETEAGEQDPSETLSNKLSNIALTYSDDHYNNIYLLLSQYDPKSIAQALHRIPNDANVAYLLVSLKYKNPAKYNQVLFQFDLFARSDKEVKRRERIESMIDNIQFEYGLNPALEDVMLVKASILFKIASIYQDNNYENIYPNFNLCGSSIGSFVIRGHVQSSDGKMIILLGNRNGQDERWINTVDLNRVFQIPSPPPSSAKVAAIETSFQTGEIERAREYSEEMIKSGLDCVHSLINTNNNNIIGALNDICIGLGYLTRYYEEIGDFNSANQTRSLQEQYSEYSGQLQVFNMNNAQ